jgi:hypothetical protein
VRGDATARSPMPFRILLNEQAMSCTSLSHKMVVHTERKQSKATVSFLIPSAHWRGENLSLSLFLLFEFIIYHHRPIHTHTLTQLTPHCLIPTTYKKRGAEFNQDSPPLYTHKLISISTSHIPIQCPKPPFPCIKATTTTTTKLSPFPPLFSIS